jgi:hypothetical protein
MTDYGRLFAQSGHPVGKMESETVDIVEVGTREVVMKA